MDCPVCGKQGDWVKYCSVKCSCVDRNKSTKQRQSVSKSNTIHNKDRLVSVRNRRNYTNGMTEIEYVLYSNKNFPKSMIPQKKAVRLAGTGSGYKCDFVDFESKLIIEIDGWNHNKSKDHFRDFFHACSGYQTIRFNNEDVRNHCDDVVEYINHKIIKRKQLEILNA